jgi:hypothetical protein
MHAKHRIGPLASVLEAMYSRIDKIVPCIPLSHLNDVWVPYDRVIFNLPPPSIVLLDQCHHEHHETGNAI